MSAAAIAVLAVSSGIALAGGDDAGEDAAITGSALEKASQSALDHVGEGRVTDTEVGDEESYYEVEVTLDDGRQVDVQLDEDFVVVGEEYEDEADEEDEAEDLEQGEADADGEKGAEDRDEDESEGRDVAITGDALETASTKALEVVEQEFGMTGTVTDTEVGDEESYYEVEVTLDDGRQVDVQLDEDFEFVDFD